MGLLAGRILPARGEGHPGALRRATEWLVRFHGEAQPAALRTPGGHRLALQRRLLDRQGGGHQIVDQAKHVGAVARAHQRLGGLWQGAGMVAAAAVGQGQGAAARAGRGGHRGQSLQSKKRR
ncbi:hypothetical protein D3C80_1338360 [compost metagenome]